MPETKGIELDSFMYSRAQSVHDRLNKTEDWEREILRGFVVNLHKDRPNISEDPKHEIALEVKYGGSWRKVVVRLTPPLYRQVVEWQVAELELQIDAKIDKRGGRQWTVAELYDMAPVPGQPKPLFQNTSPGL
jgi:hypothetical protein